MLRSTAVGLVWLLTIVLAAGVAEAQTTRRGGSAATRSGRATTAPAAARPPTTRMVTVNAPAPTTQEVERFRHEQDAQLQRVIEDPNRPRWAGLPAWVRSVWFDSTGVAWFNARTPEGGRTNQSLRVSVEEAHAGKTRVIRDATMLLIDQSRRFWVQPGSAPLQSYDGTAWTTHPITWEPPYLFHGPGFQDSAGTRWFLASSRGRGWALISVGADGKVEQHSIDQPTRAVVGITYADPAFTELDDGSMVVVANLLERPQPAGPGVRPLSEPAMLVLRRAQGRWERIEPKFCSHVIDFAFVRKEGSIRYICSGGRIWNYWMSHAMETGRKQAREALTALEDMSASRRDVAMRTLLTIGPQMVGEFPASGDATRLPDARGRLEAVRQNYEELLKADGAGLHTEPAAYDVGLDVGRVTAIGYAHDGGVAVHASKVYERAKELTHDEALVWIAADGATTVRRFPVEYMGDPEGRSMLNTGYLDRSGTLWRWYSTTIAGRRSGLAFTIDREGEFRDAALPGTILNGVAGQDARGIVYATMYPPENGSTSLVMFDASRPADTSWKRQYALGSGPYTATPVGVGWTFKRNPLRELVLTQLGLEPVEVPCNVIQDLTYRVLPLKNGAAILKPIDPDPNRRYYLYTGREWREAATFMELVRQNLETIRPLAGNTFEGFEETHLAADSKGGLWAGEVTRTPDGIGPRVTIRVSNSLFYHDGTTWHNVWQELSQKGLRGDVVRCADRGNALVVYGSSSCLWVTYQNGTLNVQQGLRQSTYNFNEGRYADDPGGGIWFAPTVNSRPPVLIDRESVQQLDFNGSPLVGDSKGRVWFYDQTSDALVAKIGQRLARAKIEGLGPEARMIESPDGRVWLLHREALSQVDVTGSGDTMQVREMGRWRWDSPKNSIRSVVIDPDGGLWIEGGAFRAVRYQLPVGQPAP